MQEMKKNYERSKIKRILDEVRKERQGRLFTYGDIKDDVVTKRYFPLGKHLWTMYRELGYEHFLDALMGEISDSLVYDVFKIRLDEALLGAKEVIEGVNKQPEKSLNWAIFPPVIPLRGDLAQGTMKLMYGDSMDISFIMVLDTNNEIFFILNGHLEDGIPVDWWLVGPDDELLQRRHRKVGVKLKDLPKKSKDNMKLGEYCTETLMDIRNERTPQWQGSAYNVAVVYMSAVMSFLIEPSTWEVGGMLWDGMNAKRVYGMPDYYFTYVPWPSFFMMLMHLARPSFMEKIIGLATQSKLVVQAFEENIQNFMKEIEPELYDEYFKKTYQDGAYWPIQSLACKPPNLKSKKTYESEDLLASWEYPPGNRITPEDLGMSVEEFTKGILFDIDITTEPWSVDPKDKILSIGWGTQMKYVK
ncbi:MAG: hypothetical protein EAX96_08195 [Candidatus Lokiarchaeota archaeon]|nr:hypothetical protein [Candidatus Lokiarchaeota archaeon]